MDFDRKIARLERLALSALDILRNSNNAIKVDDLISLVADKEIAREKEVKFALFYGMDKGYLAFDSMGGILAL